MYVHEVAPVGHVRFWIPLLFTVNCPCEVAEGLSGGQVALAQVGGFTDPVGKDWPSKLVSASGGIVGGW